jgi:Mrp family chromosome partitioning ATPase
MGTQFKLLVSDAKLGTVRQLTSHELRPWNVPEGIRDHFRRVRSTLSLSNPQESLCIAVCSTCRGEGVSWVAAMLSCAIAEESEPVFLIDYNRSHPSQNKIFGVDQNPGKPMTQSDPVDLVSRQSPRFDICILTPEASSSDGKAFAFSLRDALPKLRQESKVILIDCEPMRDSSHLLDLAPAIDGVIFVVEAERERREVIARNLESIRRASLRVFGIVLNKRKRYIPGWLYRAL